MPPIGKANLLEGKSLARYVFSPDLPSGCQLRVITVANESSCLLLTACACATACAFSLRCRQAHASKSWRVPCPCGHAYLLLGPCALQHSVAMLPAQTGKSLSQ